MRGEVSMKRTLQLCFLAVSILSALPLAGQDLREIVARMLARDDWQDKSLLEYRANRKFYAVNSRFKMDSTMYVQTVFKRPDRLESTITLHEGSLFIRSRVFGKILEAESETSGKKNKQLGDIIPENYIFLLL